MNIVTSWQVLLEYAHELGKAKLSGDEERIKKAKAEHDNYRDICLSADRMMMPCRFGDL